MSNGIRPTMGTLSGAEQISQSCRQSISSPNLSKSHVATAPRAVVPDGTRPFSFHDQNPGELGVDRTAATGCLCIHAKPGQPKGLSLRVVTLPRLSGLGAACRLLRSA